MLFGVLTVLSLRSINMCLKLCSIGCVFSTHELPAEKCQHHSDAQTKQCAKNRQGIFKAIYPIWSVMCEVAQRPEEEGNPPEQQKVW